MTRLLRVLLPGRSPLARGVDRLEGTAVIVAVMIALVLVPVMLTLGSLTHASIAEEREQQVRDRYETVAVLTEDAPASLGARGEAAATSEVPARWQLPNGTTRTGMVRADNGLEAGAEVPVWLDRSGSPVNPPLSTFDAGMVAVMVAACGWFVAVGLLALACYGLRVALDRRRYRAWQTQWAQVEPEWHDNSR
jgi:hypothetical protein